MHDETQGAVDPHSWRVTPNSTIGRFAVAVRRGYLSMLDPYLAGLEWLRAVRVDYDWVVYLSSQDYPTMTLARSEAVLADAPFDGFVRFWPALSAEGPWRRRRQGLRRYYYAYGDAPRWAVPLLRPARALNRIQSWLHVHLVYGPRVGLRRIRTPFRDGLVCYAGWQWTTLRRVCAEALAGRAGSSAEVGRPLSRRDLSR